MNNKKRKRIPFILAGCMICGSLLPGHARAEEDGIKVEINGVPQAYEQAPVNIGGSVLVPMRAIFEALGASITWTAETSTVHAYRGADIIELTIDKDNAKINNRIVPMAAAPVLVNGNTMVPIRFVGESLGAFVDWDSETETVIIDHADPTSQTGVPDSDASSGEGTPVSPLNGSGNGNANGEGVVASDSEWIYYVDGGQLMKARKDQSEVVKLAEDVVPRYITVVGDWLYFANFDLVSSPLYKIRKDGTELTKVTEESVWYMGKSGSWLIFNMVGGETSGLYRLNPDGGGRPEPITDDLVGYVNADDNWVYYNNMSDGNTFYKVKADGSGRTKLNDTHVGSVQTVGNTVFYTSIYSLALYSMNSDGSNDGMVASDVGPFNVQGDWIYYIDIYENRSLYRMRTNGTDRMLVSGDSTDNVLLAGNWLFYQNGDDGSQMYAMGLDGASKQPAYLFASRESDLTKVIVENFVQEREDAEKRRALLAKGDGIAAQRFGKTAEQVADEVVSGLIEPGMSDLEKMKVLHDYLVRHVQYDYTNYINNTVPRDSGKPYGALVLGTAVCEGYSLSLEMLLTRAGIENIHVYGTADSYKGREGHTWNLVKLDGQYYHIDVTWDDPVLSTSPTTSYDYFLRGDADMAMGHQWDSAQYPAAGDTRYHFLDSAFSLGAQHGDWYYYADLANQEHVYRFNIQTLEKEEVIAEPAYPSLVSGGWLYYSLDSDGNRLYRMQLDGGERQKLSNHYSGKVHRIGDWFVYESSFSIYKVHKDGGKPVKLSDDIPQGILVTDEHIYYNTASANDGHIYRINPDGSGRTQIDREHSIRNFRIDGDWIYFSTIFPEKNGRMRLDGSEREYLEQ